MAIYGNKIKKCLLWGTGYYYNQYITLAKFYEERGDYVIVGITANDPLFLTYGGYPYIPKRSMHEIDFDFIIVMTDDVNYQNICREAMSMGVEETCIVNCNLLKEQGFSIYKYLDIKRDIPTIFSISCWGG